MKRLRDVPRGAALSIAALVLLATAVTGREDGPKENAAPIALPAAPTAAPDMLDLEQLKRSRQETPPPDLFVPRPPPQPQVPVIVAQPSPPPAPSAPPLPYKYLGRMFEENRAVVFLSVGDRTLHAKPGETLDGTYLVESISETAVQFVYVPLGTKQTLAIPAQH